MRRLLVVLAVAASAGLIVGCGDDDDKEAAEAKKQKDYFGWVLGAKEPTAVALDLDEPNAQGKVKVKAYVCDGLGPPQGKAVWFVGMVDKAAVNKRGGSVTLKSASGKEKLVIANVSEPAISGSFTDAEGAKSQFVANPAQDGAGIYSVTLNEKLEYSGTSTDGSKLTAKADPQGATKGTIKTADGEEARLHGPEPGAGDTGAVGPARGVRQLQEVRQEQPGAGPVRRGDRARWRLLAGT